MQYLCVFLDAERAEDILQLFMEILWVQCTELVNQVQLNDIIMLHNLYQRYLYIYIYISYDVYLDFSMVSVKVFMIMWDDSSLLI